MKKNRGLSGIKDFESFERADNRNYSLWMKKYKDRGGEGDFEQSKEFKSYQQSQKGRAELLRSRNEDDYIRNIDLFEERGTLDVSEEFGDVELWNTLSEINPNLSMFQDYAYKYNLEQSIDISLTIKYLNGDVRSRNFNNLDDLKSNITAFVNWWRSMAAKAKKNEERYGMFNVEGFINSYDYDNYTFMEGDITLTEYI